MDEVKARGRKARRVPRAETCVAKATAWSRRNSVGDQRAERAGAGPAGKGKSVAPGRVPELSPSAQAWALRVSEAFVFSPPNWIREKGGEPGKPEGQSR